MRRRVNKYKDRRAFNNSARRTKAANIPGHKVPRGGIHL